MIAAKSIYGKRFSNRARATSGNRELATNAGSCAVSVAKTREEAKITLLTNANLYLTRVKLNSDLRVFRQRHERLHALAQGVFKAASFFDFAKRQRS